MLDQNTLMLVQAAVEDLAYLKSEWNQDVEDASLRRASAQMRRLLVERQLEGAWRAMGFEGHPIIQAPSLEVQLRGIPQRAVRFAQAGGAIYRGMQVDGVMEIGGWLSPEQMKQRYERTKGGIRRDYSLRRLMEAICIVVNGVGISRHAVVKYVANKLGGVHLDPKRSHKEEDQKFRLLDSIRGTYQTAEKDAIYFEVLAIGQSIVASTDIERFLDVGKATLRTPDVFA